LSVHFVRTGVWCAISARVTISIFNETVNGLNVLEVKEHFFFFNPCTGPEGFRRLKLPDVKIIGVRRW
jgi:hypothetical protein